MMYIQADSDRQGGAGKLNRRLKRRSEYKAREAYRWICGGMLQLWHSVWIVV